MTLCDLYDTYVDVVRASTAVGRASKEGRVIVDSVAETPYVKVSAKNVGCSAEYSKECCNACSTM